MASMVFKSLAFSFLVISALTMGCAKNDDTDSKEPFPIYDANSPLGKELSYASLTCATSECESNKSDFESIGLVAMASDGYTSTYSSYKIGQCTGFLYGSNDIVALNSHCITDAMWKNRSKCGEILAIKFPETPGHPSEIRSCTEIIYKSDISDYSAFNMQQDYAFFRIRPVNRAVLPLATTPTGSQQTISVRKINPRQYQTSIGGQLDYARCQTQAGSLLNTNYNSQWSETGLGVRPKNSNSSCKIIQGNSGSPVLNARNEVIGFAQSYANSDFLKIFQSETFKDVLRKETKIWVNFKTPSYLPEHFQYTQALCVRSPKNISDENTVCKLNAPIAKTDSEEATSGFTNVGSIPEYVQKLKQTMAQQQSAIFDFDFARDGEFHKYAMVPKCVMPTHKWSQSSIESSQGSGANRSVRTAKRPMFIELQVDIILDEFLVETSKVLSHKTAEGQFAIAIANNQVKSVDRVQPDGFYFYQEKLEAMPLVSWCQ